MLFCADEPTEHVAKVAFAVGAVLAPVIIASMLASSEKIIKREVA